MKHYQWSLLLFLFFIFTPLLQSGETDSIVKLFEFKAKATKALSEKQQKVPDIEDDKLSHQQELQKLRGYQAAILHIASLESSLRREEWNESRRLVKSLSNHHLSMPLIEEWGAISLALLETIDQKEKLALKTWYTSVTQLAKEAEQSCLTAERSMELDALILEMSALQLKTPSSRTVLMDRGNTIINGSILTLRNWTEFLDHRYAGNSEAANKILKSLEENPPKYPLIAVAELQKRWLPKKEVETAGSKGIAILSGLKNASDLPRVSSLWKKMIADPQLESRDLNSLKQLSIHLEHLSGAHRLIAEGKYHSALESIENSQRHGLGAQFSEPIIRLRNDIIRAALIPRIKKISGSAISADSSNYQEIFNDAITQEKQEGDYDSVNKLLELKDKIKNTRHTSNLSLRAPIIAYLAAKKFEEAGDYVMAIDRYRAVVNAQSNQYAPIEESVAALAKIKKTNPTLFKNRDAELLEQIKQLNRNLQMNRMRGR